MTEQNFIEAIKIYGQICEIINTENHNIQYEVLQLSNLFHQSDFAYQIASLYDSYHKNKDFIHLPNVETILQNSTQFPIIIARRKDNETLLGIATIKYFENNEDYTNPYFPEENAHYLEISGLLVREDNITSGFPGVGKKINEIAVLGASKLHEIHPDIRIIGVIDIRNVPSIEALKKCLNRIKNKKYFGERFLSGHIIGYYEVRDFETETFIEPQTLVLEISLTPNTLPNPAPITIDLAPQNEIITETIEKELQKSFGTLGIERRKALKDPECGNVIFCSIENRIMSRIENFTVIPHESALGNDRDDPFGTLFTTTSESSDKKVYIYE